MKVKTMLKPPHSKKQFKENILHVTLTLSRKTGLDQAGRYQSFFSTRLNSPLIGNSLILQGLQLSNHGRSKDISE